MKKYLRLPVALIAACLVVGLVAAPSASAARPTASSVNKKLNSTNKSLSSTRKSLTSTRKSLSTLGKDLATLKTRLTSAEGGVSLLLGAAPQLVSGLQQLQGALQNTVAPNLTKLGDAVTKEIVPNLTKLGEAVQTTIPAAIKDNVSKLAGSNEYGVVQPLLGATPVAGALLTSPNIPDDFNQAVLTGTAIIPVPDGTAATPITLQTAIRSGESDGTGATLPAAHVSLVSMTVAPSANVTVAGGGAGGTPLTSAPNGDLSGLPFYPINNKSPLADAGATPNPLNFPTGTGQNTDATANLNSGSKFTLANASGVAGFATITYTIRFLDLSPSTSDLTA